jgi:phosphomannomutase
VSNLSSTRALAEVTDQYGGNYVASAVGEAHVVELMKKTNAVIGGEGNGGVIYPDLHYGRDALVGIALFLSHLCHVDCSVSVLRSKYPNWLMRKDKVTLTPQHNVDALLDSIASAHAAFQVTTIDGVKIDFPDGWVHIRKSNTEPIIRIYAEAKTEKRLDELVGEIQRLVKE